jgi:PleD family two-component response regulator
MEAAMRDGPAWVLVVDDDAMARESTATGLAETGFRVRTSGTAAEAIAELSRNPYDAVVLDVELQEATGFDVHRALAAREELKDTAVLFVSGSRVDESTAVAALEAGACDFLRRPFGLGELRARLASAITSRRTIAELRRIGSVDELTGLLNRRSFFEALERERRRAFREATPLAVIVADVDRF